MVSYFVLLHDFNTNKVEKHDIMPYLIDTYNECKNSKWWCCCEDEFKAPETKEEFICFVKQTCRYRYWSRCQYEFQIIPWPPGKTETLQDCKKIINQAIKIDAWDQIEPNLEILTAVFMANIKEI